MQERADIVIVGAGAAGLMCAIHAGRVRGAQRVLLLDGAKTLGAKILVAGGGRCNVTHDTVSERDYAGSTAPAIRKVLKRFDVEATVTFFRDVGVELKREETGKLFPVTDRARTVLEALLAAVKAAGVELLHPWRVQSIHRDPQGFVLRGPSGELRARGVVLATGGKSLPKSGSDGHGYSLARALGHTITARVTEALTPLLLPEGHPLRELSGIAVPVRLEVQGSSGRRLRAFEGPLLCTHFGISGPCVLDISRYWIDAHMDDPKTRLVVNWLPDVEPHTLEERLLGLRGDNPIQILGESLPARVAQMLCRAGRVDPCAQRIDLTRAQRRGLLEACTRMVLPVTGPRGWTWAEVTAGGVSLKEVDLATMGSRRCPGLHLCGEILDVDGRIGGFNFQWAWASGYVAGRASAGA